MERTVWKKKNDHITVRVVYSDNWLGGKPINPKIPKWLVHIEFCPTDKQLPILKQFFDLHSLAIIKQAFHIKESHNITNLKNPENRTKETLIGLRTTQK